MSWRARPPPAGWTPVKEPPVLTHDIVFGSFEPPVQAHAHSDVSPALPLAEDQPGECSLRFLPDLDAHAHLRAWFIVAQTQRAR